MPRRKGSHSRATAEFLGALPELRKALAKGQTVKAFYSENKARLGLSFSYVWLCHLIRRFNILAEVEEAQLSACAAATPGSRPFPFRLLPLLIEARLPRRRRPPAR